jgi:hypothetical protein
MPPVTPIGFTGMIRDPTRTTVSGTARQRREPHLVLQRIREIPSIEHGVLKKHSHPRAVVFYSGVFVLLASLALLTASYVRPVRSTDYLQQGRDAVPWVEWGLSTSLAAVILCSTGRSARATKIAFVVGAMGLFLVWILLAESLF